MKVDIGKIVSDMDELARAAKSLGEQRTNPERIYDILEWIVEGFEGSCGHSACIGMTRNDAVKVIVEELNKLQENKTYQDAYEVIYRKKE